MIIEPIKNNIIRVTDDDYVYVVVKTYSKYEPIYTIVTENAYQLPVAPKELDGEELCKFFDANILTCF